MLLGEDGFSARVRLHAWIGIGAVGLYCATVGARSVGMIEAMTALALAVMGVMGSWASFKLMGPTDSTGENIRTYVHATAGEKRGFLSALAMAGMTATALIMAAMVGAVDSPWRIGAADGLRMAALIGMLAYVWRLKVRWRLAMLAVWAMLDIIAAWRSLGFAETPMRGDAMYALAVGAPATLALLVGLDIAEGWVKRQSGKRRTA